MGKLEMEFLNSCDESPLSCCFLVTVFMIWNHSAQNVHDFISKINNFHDTIKFIYIQCSYFAGREYQNERK